MNTSLPIKLLESLEGIAGFNKEAFIEVHKKNDSITSIRYNPFKQIADVNRWVDAKVPWSSNGFYLSQRPLFTIDPLFHAGVYYVQEASSMFLEEVMKQLIDLSKPVRVLDLCAAPGGKSTLLQSIISSDSLLVSNEVIQSRVGVLRENIIKWGGANVAVTHNDPEDFGKVEGFFDVIVVDAPCSGSGLFRKDEKAILEWSENNVQLCSHRQQRILADVLPALKEDGILIYSTCSYSCEEDEVICDWLCDELKMQSERLAIKAEWNIAETVSTKHKAWGYRFWPDKIKGEGFFISCFRKKEEHRFYYTQTKSFSKSTRKQTEILSSYISFPEQFEFVKLTEDFFAVPKNLLQDILLLQSVFRLRYAGILMGQLNKDELIPEHALALSYFINKNLPSLSLNREQSLQYLRKQDLLVETNARGWFLVTFENTNLGWVKILPNRINNYYPKEWRILKV
ncbi:MAG TPA: RNA methyltransferase [Chitinophagaceae bacterium]|nr:RNA methyltransferase [Chitinophagaceae bacterium]